MMNKNRLVNPTEAHQRVNTPLPGDDASVQLMTVYEAQKCQAIINGYLDGLLGSRRVFARSRSCCWSRDCCPGNPVCSD